MAERRRLDVEVAERGLAPSRARAQALIIAGKVMVDGRVQTKAGMQVKAGADVVVSVPDHPYASRGALKLEAALDEFSIDPGGLDCLDVGASTGGFTDLMLERGARRVIALDVGRGQLDWRLRTDDRVVVMEGINARHLAPGDLPFTAGLTTIDVSFISLRLVVPALLPHLDPGAHLVCLVKPQFEAGRDQVGKGGIVRDEAVRRKVIDDTIAAITALGFELVGVIPSPIRGQKGNLEELAVFRVRERYHVMRGGCMSSEMTVSFPGGKQVTAHYDGFDIATDQGVDSGGTGTAPEPFDLFLASLATCAGYYVFKFCEGRGISTDGITLRQSWERDKDKKLERITIQIRVPTEFPEKYRKAIVRAANTCSVKKTLADPPEIVTEVNS